MEITKDNLQQAIAALRQCAIENQDNITDTGNIRISDLCSDVANYLEKQPKLTHGSELIAIERNRQISEEGYNECHDSEYVCSELTDAAIMYAMRDYWKQRLNPMIVGKREVPGTMWPWAAKYYKPSNYPYPYNRIRDLSKAGALIAAEIDRLNTIAVKNNPDE